MRTSLGDYNTATRQWHMSGTLHAYRRRWWHHWRRRCDGCRRRQCEWADRHEAAQRALDAARNPDGVEPW